MTATNYIHSIKLTTTEKKAIADFKAAQASLAEIDRATKDPDMARATGQPSEIWDALCATADAFTAAPTLETFEAHLCVLQRADLLHRNRNAINDIGQRAANQAAASLAAVAEGIITRAEAAAAEEASTKRTAAEAAGLLAEFDQRQQALQAEFQTQRAASKEYPTSAPGWLDAHGFLD
jgi:hypothetical protein